MKKIKELSQESFLKWFFLALSLCCPALAVNEDVEGELVIYTSMYQFVIDMMDEAIKAEFPNLVPGNEGSFFFYCFFIFYAQFFYMVK